MVKKYADFVEAKSGAKVAIKKDDVSGGLIVLQFYGQQANIDEATAVLSRCYHITSSTPHFPRAIPPLLLRVQVSQSF